ncbi:unnamed protein product [Trichobilharzia regenti]|nr:unnamed protein product [Trichobilharzia regenti]
MIASNNGLMSMILKAVNRIKFHLPRQHLHFYQKLIKMKCSKHQILHNYSLQLCQILLLLHILLLHHHVLVILDHDM